MNTPVQTLPTLPATLNLSTDPPASNLSLVPAPFPGSQLPATLPATSPSAVTVSPPVLKGRPRTGAVACLPKDERDMVCRMIAKNVPYKRICQALDELGFELTERNISNWVTHGGYAQWCALVDEALPNSLRQDDLLEHHRCENSPDLAEVGLQSVAVRLSELLLRQTSSSQEAEPNLSKLEPVVNLLCRINKELFTLQKYRDDCLTKVFRTPARIQVKNREKLVLYETIYTAEPKPKSSDASASELKDQFPPVPVPTAPAPAETAAPLPAPPPPGPAAQPNQV